MSGSASEKTKTADRLHSAAIHLLRRVRQEDAAAGIGPARLSALSVLVFGGPRTLGELAAAEQVKPSTMTAIVSGLERAGLAVRRPNAADARSVHVRATAKGRRLLQRARERRVAAVVELLDRLSARELATVGAAAELLDTITRD